MLRYLLFSVLFLNSIKDVQSCFHIDKGTDRCPGDVKSVVGGFCAGGSAWVTSILCASAPGVGCVVGAGAAFLGCRIIDGNVETCK